MPCSQIGARIRAHWGAWVKPTFMQRTWAKQHLDWITNYFIWVLSNVFKQNVFTNNMFNNAINQNTYGLFNMTIKSSRHVILCLITSKKRLYRLSIVQTDKNKTSLEDRVHLKTPKFFTDASAVKCLQHLAHQENCRSIEKFMMDWTSGNHLVQSPTEGGANCKIRSGCSGHFPSEFWKSLRVEIPWFLGSQFLCLTIHAVIFSPLYSWEIAFSFQSQTVSQKWNLKPKISAPNFEAQCWPLSFTHLFQY